MPPYPLAPVGVPSGQLGAGALALVGTLTSQFHLTQRQVQSVLQHIMGMRFSLKFPHHQPEFILQIKHLT